MRLRSRPLLFCAAVLIASACGNQAITAETANDRVALPASGDSVEKPTPDLTLRPNETEPTAETTTPTTEPEPVPCVASRSSPTEEQGRFEGIASEVAPAYNSYDSERLVQLVGDGTVHDPSLELNGQDTYRTIEEWIRIAEIEGDTISIHGFGPGDPTQLFGRRSNDGLRSQGIESLSFTIQFWISQDCEWAIDTSNEISSPDPCRYSDIAANNSGANNTASASCESSFEPRSNHVAVWTGIEVLIFGGVSGTQDDPPLTSGLGYNPATGEWRDLAPAPVAVSYWPRSQGAWDGSRFVVAGITTHTQSTTADNDSIASGVTVLSYYPARDQWEVSSPLPLEDRYGVGAMVATGTEVILVGGDINAAQDDAWAYDIESTAWRQLPDPGIRPVEGMAGVWTGTEALYFGGYAGPVDGIPAVALNPDTGTWRDLTAGPGPWIQGHELVWTGDAVLLHGGNAGPSHPSQILAYDVASDSWEVSSSLPTSATQDLASAWTGETLILWGGYATYGAGESADGAIYHPKTDSWTRTASSPLGSRCHHSGTWTPQGFLVFGGMSTCGHPGLLANADAALYDPETDTWTQVQRGS